MRIQPEPQRRWTWPHYRFAQYSLRCFFTVNGGWRVIGRERVPSEGGAVIASNHLSFLDPPAVGAALRRRTYYFAKSELFVPVFGAIIRKCYAFPVERGGADTGATRAAIELLRAGELMVMFPEGTRSHDGELHELNLGAPLLASRAGVPIIPAAVWGTDRVLPVGARFFHRGPVCISFGEPIDALQFGDKPKKDDLIRLNEQLRRAIEGLRAEQRRLYEPIHGSDDDA
ncbi:MAG TPA: lysophospholipid acyltransferase family protein [Armatimonadota bacterium]|nr:lysophospholipid acyltransferase family protein [Armatimonadota bacterium]